MYAAEFPKNDAVIRNTHRKRENRENERRKSVWGRGLMFVCNITKLHFFFLLCLFFSFSLFRSVARIDCSLAECWSNSNGNGIIAGVWCDTHRNTTHIARLHTMHGYPIAFIHPYLLGTFCAKILVFGMEMPLLYQLLLPSSSTMLSIRPEERCFFCLLIL